MKSYKLFSVVILLICLSCSATRVNTMTQTNKRSTYYYQRKSLFEKLPNTENEIIFLGNSITDGGNWSELFNDVRVKNRGISGDVTDGVLERLDEVIESMPDKIFIMIGVNDLARGRSVDDVISNYRDIVERIVNHSKKTKIYIQSILPVNSDFQKFRNHTNKTKQIMQINEQLKKIAELYGATYIDLYSLFVNEQNKLNPKYTNDGLHLTGEGYMLWKSAVENFVNE